MSGSTNSRHVGVANVEQLIEFIKEGSVLPVSAILRLGLINSDSYEKLTGYLQTSPLAIPNYYIINNDYRGQILEMDKGKLFRAYNLTNQDKDQWYLVQTNDDRGKLGLEEELLKIG